MITNFFIPELNNHDVQELWFQQDGATCHTARATIDLLKDTFGDHLISRFGPVNWPPRSCDLTPLDCFLWGYENDNHQLSLGYCIIYNHWFIYGGYGGERILCGRGGQMLMVTNSCSALSSLNPGAIEDPLWGGVDAR
ncbi:uncharacterized protein TNCV_1605091 [Trichonephila clavipes]|nr:uncharacterized protein TNCV_1605091 [Trichonephila clavipes]